MIPVSQPYLPDRERLNQYLDGIYERAWLTNNGPLVQELEHALADYLGVKHVICVANGSLALQLGYHALGLTGEVITTPFSYIATTSTLQWEQLTPRFADIDPFSFNLDPDRVEPLINEHTSAILPVHVFGNPCDTQAIQTIADRHQLPVIYDAAHAFGVRYQDLATQKYQSILTAGTLSAVSFHATKLFHTVEGGAIMTQDDALASKIRAMMNFGQHNGTINHIGTNAKMSEFHAAMGLCNLAEINYIQSARAQIWEQYYHALEGRVQLQSWAHHSTQNHAYAPILLRDETECLRVLNALADAQIQARRYFHPSLDTLVDSDQCPHSQDIASRILCLPIYPAMSEAITQQTIHCIHNTLRTV